MQIAIDFNQPIITTITKRNSVRTYQPIEISQGKIKTLQDAAKALGKAAYRFSLIELNDGSSITGQIGTYGVVKGASVFLVGIMQKDAKRRKNVAIHFGYDFEQLILKATELCLGTCWIAGTYIPLFFTKKISPSHNEKIAMVSPLGISAKEWHVIGEIATRISKPKTRKPRNELFFNENAETPLLKKNAGDYSSALEMVRLAPSAVNSQPWRVIRINGDYHFFAADTRYYHLVKINFLRYNDMGIALSHFELACRELGLKGKWINHNPLKDMKPGLEYIQTWKPAK